MQGSKYKRSTKTATRIYNRFEFWSVADCDCKYCPNFNVKSKLCPLDICSIADIKQEAARREQAAVQVKIEINIGNNKTNV